jgi:predicted metalloprotease with PDZ domain
MAATATPIRYRIRPSRPEAHLFRIELALQEPAAAGQRFSLPAWIPGSYMIREFARNVVTIAARCRGRPVALEKIDKHTWQAAPCDGPLTLDYEVYAWDLSVRGAHLDTTHGFFNGTSVFLCVQGQEASPCEVDIEPPRGPAYRHWRVATALPTAGAERYGFGRYRAQSYDELIDHPVEMGSFSLVTFRARGVPHDVAISGRHDCDLQRIARDLKRVCEYQIDLFGGKAPMRRYVFLVMALGEGYGGLEHRASTALVCSRWDLPRAGTGAQDERYLTFLGLASHEYFHTWNVKRIKPAAFTPYDLTRENYTRLLWAFEGITSYYDDLALVRCGLMTAEQYLQTLARTLTAVQRGSGRLKQTVAESSFDAWIKYYRQDENAPNAIVSYYAKGALIALALDLTIRKASRGGKSLDDLMRTLWSEFGRDGRGVGESELEAVAERATGVALKRFFERTLRSTADIDWAPLLGYVGLKARLAPAQSSADRGGGPAQPPKDAPPRAVLGARIDAGGGDVKLGQVFDAGAAQAAGLSAGDVVVAIDGIRCTPGNWEQLVARHRPGDTIRVTGFRRDELFEREVRLLAAPADTYALWPDPSATPAQRRARARWLSPR